MVPDVVDELRVENLDRGAFDRGAGERALERVLSRLRLEHPDDRLLNRRAFERAHDRLLGRGLDRVIDPGRRGDPLAGAGADPEQARGQRRAPARLVGRGHRGDGTQAGRPSGRPATHDRRAAFKPDPHGCHARVQGVLVAVEVAVVHLHLLDLTPHARGNRHGGQSDEPRRWASVANGLLTNVRLQDDTARHERRGLISESPASGHKLDAERHWASRRKENSGLSSAAVAWLANWSESKRT